MAALLLTQSGNDVCMMSEHQCCGAKKTKQILRRLHCRLHCRHAMQAVWCGSVQGVGAIGIRIPIFTVWKCLNFHGAVSRQRDNVPSY